MTTPSEKRKQTIIDKWGSWEEYKQHRYYKPGEEELRKERAKYAIKHHKGNRGFSDPKTASKAGKKSWENRRADTENLS